MGASAKKSFARSRIFRYGLRRDILSRGQKPRQGGGNRNRPPPPPPPMDCGVNWSYTFYLPCMVLPGVKHVKLQSQTDHGSILTLTDNIALYQSININPPNITTKNLQIDFLIIGWFSWLFEQSCQKKSKHKRNSHVFFLLSRKTMIKIFIDFIPNKSCIRKKVNAN